MKGLVNAMMKSLEDKNWYGALTIALIIPDICGCIDTPNSYSSKRYVRWFDQYVSHKYYLLQKNIEPGRDSVAISGSDCYAIRCALMHEFSSDLEKQRAHELLTKYTFSSPGNIYFAYQLRCNESGNVIDINVSDFCEKMRIGFSIWEREKQPVYDNLLKVNF
ncbi:hypothetical protein [Anaerosinus sp.]